MKNINNNSMKLGFKILSFLAFSLLVIPMSAGAYYVTPYGSYGSVNNSTPAQPQYSYPIPVNYYVPANNTTVIYPTTQTTVRPNNTTVVTPPPVVAPAETSTDTSNKTDANYSNLAANAIYGSNNLMPSGIIQWVLFAILILIIVILVRKIFGAEKKYHSTPLKHA